MNLSVIWLTPWPAQGNFWGPIAEHLWQSTLFGAVVALLMLPLKKNRAQIRYALWQIASVKFLVPFSLLVAVGNYLPWLRPPGKGTPGILFLIRGPLGAGRAAVAEAGSGRTWIVPAVLLIAWAMGTLAVLVLWWLRWRRTMAITRGAASLREGREFDTLRGLEKTSGMKQRVDLVSAAIPLEPGIVGLFRPVLFLPAGISERLTQAQLEGILSHELCHVRRRDNLVAALHLLVVAVFWFHPLAWWIGARMMEERERACDEEVLASGSDPHVYAESILRVCELRLETPPVLMAGVTGAKLKERIEAIMGKQPAAKLDTSRRAFLATMGIAAVVGPVAAGVLTPQASRLEAGAQSAPQSGTKYILGEIRIEGEVHDREGIQDRILKAWRGREYDDAKQLEDAVVQDGVRLEFQNRGYFKVLVKEPVSQQLGNSAGKQSIRLVIPIQEGAQYRLGTLTFQNADAGKPLSIPAETLREQIHLRSGDVVNISQAHEGMQRIKKLYGAKNIESDVTPEASIDDERHIIDAIFRVKETAQQN
ncbi:MAG TPA: M56 family metallopeptidase [Candidatus Eisenbacteria bacterium]|nr:M56 family metallopeptidase [Candidatus Eisenbacteria bacterium]